MKESDNTKVSFLVNENRDKGSKLPQGERGKMERLKKPLIFVLMTVVCAGCLYLIFQPGDQEKNNYAGLNDAVPQATDAGLQTDKQKAYETQLMEQKKQEERSALASLSDYWKQDKAGKDDQGFPEQEPGPGAYNGRPHHREDDALISYKNAQNALGSFYRDNGSEAEDLRRQVEELREELAQRDAAPPENNIDNQLALMEKSYQMAAKYLPAGSGATATPKADSAAAASSINSATPTVAFTPVRSGVVSALYRELTDSAFLDRLSGDRHYDFNTAGIGGIPRASQAKNSVLACVEQTQVVMAGSDVPLRLLEPAAIAGMLLPTGTALTAHAKLESGRLQLRVNSVELEGHIAAVDITIYGLDGQQGLVLPYSPEQNALTEIASNMAQTSGTSIMMTRSAGQQIAGDLGRGLVQGVSGYFSKKIRTVKVTLKAGLQVLLVAKK
ncbi:conjugative transposon protein TraM [Chitinophaga caeni]|uniref:Conjugative transposon protein TraM n=1 Tax=Chitinophaga caeni TaxID=2029983 RepID=A0A291QYK0_9BACT|nr:conjugative transposon protein TraM [Chitinophaga caeni]ATL48944.1 conjugative transposon protein TraM [Chitinophaga caeni]